MSTKFATVCCDECKHEFPMMSVKIQKATVNINGKEYTLSFFACPKCRRIYRIALMDQRYNELKDDLDKIRKKIRKSFGSGDVEMTKNLQIMAMRKQERMQNYVNALNGKYPGTFIFAVSENSEDNQTIKYLP